ncbi:MAG: glycosyltransferase family 2 protein [Candidatus Berkelbacteria bacterium]|nr:glycosyltransferase family 2 protein [Candidatus Berkelbacteria bacterium]
MKRFCEIIPGFFCWTTLLAPVFLALFSPTSLAYFLICFDLYWLYKAFFMGGYLLAGFKHYKHDMEIDWLDQLNDLKSIDNYIEKLKIRLRNKSGFIKRKIKRELEEAFVLKEKEKILINWRTLYQAVIFPNYNEEIGTLRNSIKACLDAKWPKEKMIVVLAMEEREGEKAREKARILKKEFEHKFFKFLVTEHPAEIPGEMKAKGANSAWAAKKLQKLLDEQRIAYENVIVSTFDSDTRADPQYFACLAYKFIINPNRLRRTYQPIPFYSNNIWYVPAWTRLVAFSSSFWQLVEATRPYRMVNFSSQAMSMQTLVDINFWDTTVVSEDSRQFFRAYFTYGGNHRVVPIFVPVYMDAVVGRNFWDTVKEQYYQKRRWAWGVEHFPYLCQQLPKHKEISLLSRFVLLWRQFEGHYSWATSSLLLAFAGWLPFALSPVFRSSVIAYNLPVIARVLLSLTWIGLFVSTYISVNLMPKKPKGYGFFKTLEIYLQWILVPITAIFFGSIPAVDAETRLMFGKYMGFRVTKKIPNLRP